MPTQLDIYMGKVKQKFVSCSFGTLSSPFQRIYKCNKYLHILFLFKNLSPTTHILCILQIIKAMLLKQRYPFLFLLNVNMSPFLVQGLIWWNLPFTNLLLAIHFNILFSFLQSHFIGFGGDGSRGVWHPGSNDLVGNVRI